MYTTSYNLYDYDIYEIYMTYMTVQTECINFLIVMI